MSVFYKYTRHYFTVFVNQNVCVRGFDGCPLFFCVGQNNIYIGICLFLLPCSRITVFSNIQFSILYVSHCCLYFDVYLPSLDTFHHFLISKLILHLKHPTSFPPHAMRRVFLIFYFFIFSFFIFFIFNMIEKSILFFLPPLLFILIFFLFLFFIFFTFHIFSHFLSSFFLFSSHFL